MQAADLGCSAGGAQPVAGKGQQLGVFVLSTGPLSSSQSWLSCQARRIDVVLEHVRLGGGGGGGIILFV